MTRSLVAGLALAGIAAAPFLAEALRRPMDAAARRAAPGSFAPLSRGLTHYRWLGPETGAVAVCVHGLTTPSYVWDGIARGLAAEGYRVLVYDHYGRGFSDRPGGPQDADFFIGHLQELLAYLGVTDRFTLLGYSMGGAIAAAYGARHPDRLRQVILLAPAGMGHEVGPVARAAMGTGIAGRWLFLAEYGRGFRAALAAERGHPGISDAITDLQLRELDFRGFRPAVLSSLRHLLRRDFAGAHRALARSAVPVTAIWGAEDDVIPLSGRDRLARWNPAARQAAIPGAGHALTYSHAAEVLAMLRELMIYPSAASA